MINRYLDATALSPFARLRETPILEHALSKIDAVRRLPRSKKQYRRNMDCALANLIRAEVHGPSPWIYYSRDSHWYTADAQGGDRISRGIIRCFDDLAIAGLVIQKKGMHCPRAKFRTRVRATPALGAIFAEYRLSRQSISDCPPLLQLRGSRDPAPHPEAARLTESLTRYNNLLSRTDIRIINFPAHGLRPDHDGRALHIHLNKKRVHRVFSRNWYGNGRFTGGFWMHLSKCWRERIYINGEPTKLHPHLLDAKEMENINYDYYDFSTSGLSNREFAKVVVLRILYAPSKRKAIQAIRQHLNRHAAQYPNISRSDEYLGGIIDTVLKARPSLAANAFKEGLALRLMNVESQIAERVIDILTMAGIPVLSVHDSFIVPARHAKRLQDAMQSAYIEITANWLGRETPIPSIKLIGAGAKLWEMFTFLRRFRDLPVYTDPWKLLCSLTGQEHTDFWSGSKNHS